MMTNVRASNLHPAFLLRGILKGFRTLLASLGGGDDGGGGGFLVYLVDLPSAAPYPSSPKSPKTSRNTMRDVTFAFEKDGREGGRVLSAGERVERPSSRRFGKLPLFLSCGDIPVADIRYGDIRTHETSGTRLSIRSFTWRGQFLIRPVEVRVVAEYASGPWARVILSPMSFGSDVRGNRKRPV
jgi:hypothetical protein